MKCPQGDEEELQRNAWVGVGVGVGVGRRKCSVSGPRKRFRGGSPAWAAELKHVLRRLSNVPRKRNLIAEERSVSVERDQIRRLEPLHQLLGRDAQEVHQDLGVFVGEHNALGTQTIATQAITDPFKSHLVAAGSWVANQTEGCYLEATTTPFVAEVERQQVCLHVREP